MVPELALAIYTGQLAVINAVTETTAATNPADVFLQYGVLGLIVIGFLTGQIVPGIQAKQLLADNQRLTALVEGKLFPMMESTNSTMERTAGAMEKATTAFEHGLEEQRYARGERS